MSAFVCGDCLADEGLARFVARAASADACSFCTHAYDSPIAASVSDVAKFMRQCLEQDYGHPTADQAGGYPPGAIFATHALLDKIPLQLRNPTVLGPLCEEIGLNLEWTAPPSDANRDVVDPHDLARGAPPPRSS